MGGERCDVGIIDVFHYVVVDVGGTYGFLHEAIGITFSQIAGRDMETDVAVKPECFYIVLNSINSHFS